MCACIAPAWIALLSGSKYRPSNSLRKPNWREESLRIEIILARFVDDANQPVLGRIGIRKNAIDLAALQRNFVPVILKADDELFCCRSHRRQSMKCLILKSRRPIPCASYPGTSAWRMVPSSSRTRAMPLRFLHRPRPFAFGGGRVLEWRHQSRTSRHARCLQRSQSTSSTILLPFNVHSEPREPLLRVGLGRTIGRLFHLPIDCEEVRPAMLAWGRRG